VFIQINIFFLKRKKKDRYIDEGELWRENPKRNGEGTKKKISFYFFIFFLKDFHLI
jgi:hypothetical protein